MNSKKCNLKLILLSFLAITIIFSLTLFYSYKTNTYKPDNNSFKSTTLEKTVTSNNRIENKDTTIINTNPQTASSTNYEENKKSNPATNKKTIIPSSSSKDKTLTLNLYKYTDYIPNQCKPDELKSFVIQKDDYEKNRLKVLNQVFSETGIVFRNINIIEDDNRIIADLTQESATKFDWGSCGGGILTNELVMTLLNLPNIKKLEVTIEGSPRVFGNHFSFDGIFVLNNKGFYELIEY